MVWAKLPHGCYVPMASAEYSKECFDGVHDFLRNESKKVDYFLAILTAHFMPAS